MESILQSLEGPVFSAIRPYITPYTSALPPSIQEPLQNLLTPICYNNLIRDFDPASNPQCVQYAISKAIGLGIVTLSTIIKVPQLIKLLSSQSSKGLSYLSYLLETTAYLCTLAYNFRSGNPFSTYGEIAMLAVQNVLISTLILQFSGKGGWAAVWVAALAAAGYALFQEGIISPEIMVYLQTATIPLVLASKVPQIIEIARQKSTGQLSAFAVFNYLFGSLARVFTTLSEVNDPLILWGFIGGAALNAVLAAQMMYYWNSGQKGGKSPNTHSKKFYAKGKSPKPKSGSKKRA
ncbi:mannose-P-dolichol utilization defect 1 protein [Choiromyces venosus 120613-1]|uniref:Mannose-P-dolichol utilization defect 1 protein homolog n=1 Tax=Choiromyces venosus 120613-1 TaxID=1336337 RepID=A0A3N4JIX5_9PEZI|nr:mannose-P-dolichol utilization defect 1 protein [Choiromyces venosus 120613-1]